MSLSRVVDIAASALTAQRLRMELASANMANAETTRTPEGGPYRRRVAIFRTEPAAPQPRRGFAATPPGPATPPGGVEVAEILADPAEPALRYQPGHPDADAEGYVRYPNVNPTEEMVDLLSAARSYEAGISVVKVTRQLLQATLNLLR